MLIALWPCAGRENREMKEMQGSTSWKKWILRMGISCMMLFLAGCRVRDRGGASGEGESFVREAETRAVEEEKEPGLFGEDVTWLACEALDFAMVLPKSLVGQNTDEAERNMVFRGENDSFTVELFRWDQVSDPNDAALAELVSKAVAEEVEIVTSNGRELLKVHWPHGDVNYYLLAPDGDAYVLWITPYVMKDPAVYQKVRAMEESICKASEIPAGEERLPVKLPEGEILDTLVLVNGKHPLPEGWEERLDLVTMVNSVGDTVQVERGAYKAYLELKRDLAENEGIEIDLDSAYRSMEYQQEILERFTEKYGAAYAARTVAKPGTSEHQTGLALDLYFRLDGEDVYENEDLVQYPEIWKKIHVRLAAHGFILRYPGGKDGVVDYGYEPWHIRYVGEEAAGKITAVPGVTLEDWLDGIGG